MKPCRFRPFPALMVLAFILTGCAAASQQEPSADGPLDPKNPVTISIWNYYNGAQLSSFNDLVKKFNETDGKVQGIFVESFSQGSVNDLESNVLAAAQGKVIAASYYGKVKTVLQILAILLFIVKDTLQIKLLGGGVATGFTIFSWVVLGAAVVMTLVSLLDYFNKTKDLLGFGSKKEA